MIERQFPDGTRIVSVEHRDGAVAVILEADGRKVSRTIIVPLLIRLGAAVVRIDGIGGVETEEAYRNRGYQRRVMERAVEKMRSGDAALSLLFGIPDFYPKFGYTTVGPEYTVTAPLPPGGDPPPLPEGWVFRPFALDDLPAVRQLYHDNTRRAIAAVVRHDAGDELPENDALIRSNPGAVQLSHRPWNRLEQPGAGAEDACRVLVDASGALVGYAWLGRGCWWIDHRRRDAPESFHVGEVMARDPAAADVVLLACRRWAVETGNGMRQVELVLPPNNRVAQAAAYEWVRFVAQHSRRGEFMGRVLDVGRLLRQVRPELAARVRASRLSFPDELIFRTEAGEASLFITPDGVSVEGSAGGWRLTVELPQDELARLCLGAFDTADVLARLPEPPSPETVALLEVLFPRRSPHIYPMDRF